MYAKLLNGELQIAPQKLCVGGNNVWNPKPEQYAAAGYKPVEFTELPEAPDGWYYEAGWTETETAIVQTWTLTELSTDISDDEALTIILGGDGT